MMREEKRKRLEKKGWQVGEVTELLALTDEEEAYIELKLALSLRLRELRSNRNLTQQEVARRIGSSQSRVAKMEAGDPTVSVDLLIRTLLALGASRDDLAGAIAS